MNTITKKVFIGKDVHRKSYILCCVVDGVIVKKCQMKPRFADVIGFIKKHFAGYEVFTVYEAGFSGFELHRALEGAGFNSIVVHPAAVEVSNRDRKVKTDKRDAKKLAIQLAAGRLEGIRIPSREEEQRRQLTRTREQIVEHRSAIKNQIRSKFHIFSLLDPDDDRELSLAMVDQILSKVEIEELKIAVGSLRAVWVSYNEQLKVLHVSLREQAKSDPLDKTYRSVPGFGPLASRIISNELGDLQHFASCKDLYSFTGLTPGEHSSGDNIHRNNITRQGSARLRHILVQAAWVAIRQDKGLLEDFGRIAKNGNKLKAIVAIARKLIGRARALFRDNVLYEPRSCCAKAQA